MKRGPDEVHCLKCVTKIGVVREVPVEGKIGFFRNECDPNPMPTKCPTCKEPLTRVHTNLEG